MDYQFTATVHRSHLHVIGTGTHSADNVRRLLADTNRVIVEQHIDAVLLELRFVGPSLDLGHIYSIIADNRADAMLVKRIGYVDTNAEHLPDRTEFAELAANRLGVNARVFQSVVDAEAWLTS